jgi:hypothetical protein
MSKVDHLKRLGLEPHDKYVSRLNDTRKTKNGLVSGVIDILGRRSRKEWNCASPTCTLGPIELDSVYIEFATGTNRYTGKTSRYHVACALTAHIVAPVSDRVATLDKGNGRRQGIMEQRARKEASAN